MYLSIHPYIPPHGHIDAQRFTPRHPSGRRMARLSSAPSAAATWSTVPLCAPFPRHALPARCCAIRYARRCMLLQSRTSSRRRKRVESQNRLIRPARLSRRPGSDSDLQQKVPEVRAESYTASLVRSGRRIPSVVMMHDGADDAALAGCCCGLFKHEQAI